MIDVYSASEQASERITLVLQADSKKMLHTFASLYLQVAELFGCQTRLGVFHRPPEPLPTDDDLVDAKWATMRSEILPVDEALDAIHAKGTLALALEAMDHHAFLRFRAEEGVHVFLDGDEKSSRAQIRAFDATLEKCWCEIATMIHPDLTSLAVRRQFDESKGSIKDTVLARKVQGSVSAELIAEWIDENLHREAESQL